MSCNVPCPPPPPPPVDQSCLPPPPPACHEKMRPKPIMRCLHFQQTKRILTQALTLSAISGALWFFLIGQRRRAAYKDFYERTDLEEWAEDMAKKGLFQAVPKPS